MVRRPNHVRKGLSTMPRYVYLRRIRYAPAWLSSTQPTLVRGPHHDSLFCIALLQNFITCKGVWELSAPPHPQGADTTAHHFHIRTFEHPFPPSASRTCGTHLH